MTFGLRLPYRLTGPVGSGQHAWMVEQISLFFGNRRVVESQKKSFRVLKNDQNDCGVPSTVDCKAMMD